MSLLHKSAMSPVVMLICIRKTFADPQQGGELCAVGTEDRRAPR